MLNNQKENKIYCQNRQLDPLRVDFEAKRYIIQNKNHMRLCFVLTKLSNPFRVDPNSYLLILLSLNLIFSLH